MKVLFTGFEAEDAEDTDITWKWISNASEWVGDEHFVKSMKLPISWEGCFAPLRSQLNQGWDAIVCVGAKDTEFVSIERVANNETDLAYRDSLGNFPRSKIIDTNGEPGYWSSLPYRELAINLTSAKIPATPSRTPGSVLPNYLFYQLMNWISFSRRTLVGGLIQVPFSGTLLNSNPQMAKIFTQCILNTLSRSSKEEDSLMIDLSRFEQLRESPTP